MSLSGDLKHKTVLMAALAGLAYGGAAGATIGTGSLSEGELFLDLINTAAGVSATFDLGVPMVVSQPAAAALGVDPTIETFALNALSQAGIRLEWNVAGTAAWRSFVGAAGESLASSKFDIKALGPSDPFLDDEVVFLTTASAGDLASQDFAELQRFGQVGKFFVAETNTQATHSTEANGANFTTSANTTLYHEIAVGNSWRNSFVSGTAISTGPIGADLRFYRLFGTSDNLGGTAAVKPYGGVWNLSKAGVLSYVTPVPEPGSWAVLLAGLAGVGAIARRRCAPLAGHTAG